MLIEPTIGETVKQDFRAAQVFSRYGIDFCCGGKKTLSEVCKSKNLNEGDIRKELALLAASDPDGNYGFTEMEPDDLCDYIVTKHHRYINRTVPVIYQYLEKVVKVHGHGYPELAIVQENFLLAIDELNRHMMKEEHILFPYVSELAKARREKREIPATPFGSVENPIRMMEHEHDTAGGLIGAINQATKNYTIPPEACNTFRVLYQSLQEFENDLHVHIHLENNILFPAAIALEKELGPTT